MKTLILLCFTLIIVSFDNYAEAYVGPNKDGKYLRKDNAVYFRRFLIPVQKENSDKSNNKNDEIINKNKIYDDIVNQIRLENLEQSLNEEMYKTNWIITKIVNIPKKCFGLAERRSDKSKHYFISLDENNHDKSENKKIDIVTKIASLENLEQSLSDEMFKANWMINKIINIAKHCFGLGKRPINIENDDALLNKIYDEIVNKSARLDILQKALDCKMYNIDSSINKIVNIAKYRFELGKSHSEHSRRFSIPIVKENDDTLINKIYDEIVNKTTRLEILQEALGSKMYKINSLINKTVNIAEYCFGLEKRRDSLVRRKRDIGKVLDKDSNNATKAKTTDIGARRSLLQANEGKNEIQQKLLNYIDDTFGDIENKMQALNATKEQFANDDNYKIGYIMSNIDTLKVNVANIKKEVEKNKDLWSDKQILDVYDTVIKSNKALSNLLNILGLLTSGTEQG